MILEKTISFFSRKRPIRGCKNQSQRSFATKTLQPGAAGFGKKRECTAKKRNLGNISVTLMYQTLVEDIDIRCLIQELWLFFHFARH